MSAITVTELFFSYNESPVLEDVTFSLEEKEFVAVFGPNGGGKTTLLQLLMGFLKPARGTIRLFGRPPKTIRQCIGWVPQNFHFDRHFPISVEEVVLGGRLNRSGWRFRPTDIEAAQAALERVGMGKALKSPFAVLSGGQQQRVLIARALACDPALLLLDEPTSGVDHAAEKEIYSLLGELRKHLTILMVTHDLNRAVESVDRLLCVQKTVTQMPKEKVCEHFALGLYHPKEENP
ncbi:MAG: ABC transporter ATP-binding protein [Chlamydiales bacterium]|nr:ABC transporter ATP-binding protein [Chlamydiales bacterium]